MNADHDLEGKAEKISSTVARLLLIVDGPEPTYAKEAFAEMVARIRGGNVASISTSTSEPVPQLTQCDGTEFAPVTVGRPMRSKKESMAEMMKRLGGVK